MNDYILFSTLLWYCLFFNFTQFVILENLSILYLALLGVKGVKVNIVLYLVQIVMQHHKQVNHES